MGLRDLGERDHQRLDRPCQWGRGAPRAGLFFTGAPWVKGTAVSIGPHGVVAKFGGGSSMPKYALFGLQDAHMPGVDIVR